MGCAASFKIFDQISDAIVWVLKRHNVDNLVKILDDFLIVAEFENLCEFYLNMFTKICDLTGFPLAKKKTVHACRSLTF